MSQVKVTVFRLGPRVDLLKQTIPTVYPEWATTYASPAGSPLCKSSR